MASLGHHNKFQRVSRLGSVTARHSSSGHHPNFAALNRGRHIYSAGRPSRWALAHISSCSIIYRRAASRGLCPQTPTRALPLNPIGDLHLPAPDFLANHSSYIMDPALPVKGQWQCSLAGKATIGLMLRWPCVTVFVVYHLGAHWPSEREMSCRSMAPFTFITVLCGINIKHSCLKLGLRLQQLTGKKKEKGRNSTVHSTGICFNDKSVHYADHYDNRLQHS